MSSWILFALVSVFAVTFAEFLQKILITDDADLNVETNNFVVWTFIGILASGYLLISKVPFVINFSPTQWALFLFSCLIYFGAGFFYYRSFKGISASVASILMAASSLNSVVLGAIFLGDRFTFLNVLGMLLVLASMILVSLDDLRKTGKLNKYYLYALLGGFLFGIGYTFDKKFVLDVTPDIYTIIMPFGVAFLNMLFCSKRIAGDFKKLKTLPKMILGFAISACLYLLYIRFTFLAYWHGGEVGSVDSVNNSVAITLIPLEILILKDRKNLLIKAISAVVCVLGIYLLK